MGADAADAQRRHNYAKRRLADDNWAKDHQIGSAEVPAEAFEDFWRRLADLFKDDGRICFGLMNEPVGLAAEAWLAIVNRVIATIRQTGARNLILVPGVAYTGAHSWLRSGNIAMKGVLDPQKNFALEVHQYFDHDSSGTRPQAVSATIGSERIQAFQTWARENGFRAFLGEFGAGGDETSLKALADICREMKANADVWLGWAAWAGGPRWPEHEFTNLEPYRDGREREQTSVLKAFAAPEPSR